MIRAIRARTPGVSVEVLIPDCKGDPDALERDLPRAPRRAEPQPRDGRPPAARRPPVGRLRPLAVGAGPGQGGRPHHQVVAHRRPRRDRPPRCEQALADLAGVGVDIVTIGQYLRPTSNHLPVARWWTPDELTALKHAGEAMGIGHVEAGPLVRSSYHARQAADAAATADVEVDPRRRLRPLTRRAGSRWTPSDWMSSRPGTSSTVQPVGRRVDPHDPAVPCADEAGVARKPAEGAGERPTSIDDGVERAVRLEEAEGGDRSSVGQQREATPLVAPDVEADSRHAASSASRRSMLAGWTAELDAARPVVIAGVHEDRGPDRPDQLADRHRVHAATRSAR